MTGNARSWPRLFHAGLRQLPHPEARLLLRVDVKQASAAQFGHIHLVAHQHFPELLEQVFSPGGAQSGPVPQRAIASIAPEAARAVLGR